MPVNLKNKIVAISVLVVWLALSGLAMGQQPKSLVVTANGQGTIKLGKEQFKLNAVVVKAFEDGKAEISLVTDITIFINGTWAWSADRKTIDLTITGGSVANNLDGGGKIFVNEDNKSISSLKLSVLNKISRKVISADFTAK